MLDVVRLVVRAETRVTDIAERIADEFGLATTERTELVSRAQGSVLRNGEPQSALVDQQPACRPRAMCRKTEIVWWRGRS